MFSYEFKRLDFSTDQAEMSVLLKSASGDVLLSESYNPDRYCNITLWDLDTEVSAYIGDAPYASFTLTVDGNLMATIKVLRCNVAYDVSAETFCNGHFLTAWEGVRRTSVGRYECLSFYASSVVAVTATVSWMDASGGLIRETVTVRAADYAAGTVVMVDVSPGRFVRSGRTLAGYRIDCGARSVRYRVDYPAIEAEPSMIFRNRFFVWETVHFEGTRSSAPNYTREAAWINGQYVNYDIEEVKSYTAMTAPLPLGAEEVIEDLARSRTVHLLDSTGAARDLVTVTEVDAKATNDINALNVLSVTYRLADRITAKSYLGARAKIFDNTYDTSYE